MAKHVCTEHRSAARLGVGGWGGGLMEKSPKGISEDVYIDV